MNNVFILGAGASRELRFYTGTISQINKISQVHNLQGPLSRSFLFYANEFMKEIDKITPLGPNTKISHPWLIKFIEEYYFAKTKDKVTFDDLVNKELKLNIEELCIAVEKRLAEISQKNTAKGVTEKELSAEIGRRKLLEYIHEVFSTIAFYCYSIYHRILANYITGQGVNIICFNWDTLFEEEMYATGKWDYYDGYGFKPAGFIDKNKSLRLNNKYLYRERQCSSTNIIFKPHGSINWYQKIETGEDKSANLSDEIYIGIPLTRLDAFRGGTTSKQGQLRFMEIPKPIQYKQHYESIMVPPGEKRKQFAFIWERIKNLLTEADVITSIGFSFNDFDTHITEEFKNIEFKKSLVVNIVNPNNSDLIKKYEGIFRVDKITTIGGKFSDYCKWITTQKGMENFATLLLA